MRGPVEILFESPQLFKVVVRRPHNTGQQVRRRFTPENLLDQASMFCVHMAASPRRKHIEDCLVEPFKGLWRCRLGIQGSAVDVCQVKQQQLFRKQLTCQLDKLLSELILILTVCFIGKETPIPCNPIAAVV